MIQRVSAANISFKQNNANSTQKQKNFSVVKEYAESFTRNTIESTPIMLAFTGFWTLFDKFSGKISFNQALSNNLKNFFLPVTLASSAILAVIETKKISDNRKNGGAK